MNINPSGNSLFRSGLTLTAVQYEQLQQSVSELAHSTPAQFILLADVTGQVVLTHGSLPQANLTALGSLVAGDMAASQEIARLTGQYDEYQLVLREGKNNHSLIMPAGSRLALLMQIAHETPLGWARLLIRKTAIKIAEIAQPPNPQSTEAEQPPLSDDDVMSMLDDSIDTLWEM